MCRRYAATDSDEADCKSEVAPSIPKLSSADKDVAAICTEASQQGAHVGRPSKFNFTESLGECTDITDIASWQLQWLFQGSIQNGH